MISTRDIVDYIKVSQGCQSGDCAGHPNIAAALEFDHIDPSTKYRTRAGKVVHPADMIKGNRYSLDTILREIGKCRVLCSNCHKVYTHTVQRAA